MRYKMNFMKSMKNDYLLGLSWIFMLVCLAGCIYLKIVKDVDFFLIFQVPITQLLGLRDFIPAFIFTIITIVGLICFICRISYIKSFEKDELIVEGKVFDIRYVKDRCGVDVVYLLNGEQVKKHFALFNNKQTKYVHMDSVVELLVKEDKPKKCLIAELYFDTVE